MRIQDFDERVPHYMRGIVRIILTAMLAIILGLSGLLTIAFAGGNVQGTGPYSIAGGDFIIAHPGNVPTTPAPSRGATSTSRPDPSPTGPLPPMLSQAIAALQQQDRLLYQGNTHLPEIALTFDDGPNPYYTPQILAILRQYNVKATFFCIGRLVETYPGIVRQEYAAGNIIGDHSWSHPELTLLSLAAIRYQIMRGANDIQAAIGVRPVLFRPPYGAVNVMVLTQIYHLGLTTILWNDEARDWERPGTQIIVERILSLARDGAIILMHDGGGDRSETVAALPFIIKALRQRGFRFVTIPQMLTDLHQQKSSGNNGPPNSLKEGNE